MPNVPPPKPVFIDGEEIDPSLLTPEELAGFDEFADIDTDAAATVPDPDDDPIAADETDDAEARQDSDVDPDDDDEPDDATAQAEAGVAPQDTPGDDPDPDEAAAASVDVFRLSDIPPAEGPSVNTTRLEEIQSKIEDLTQEFDDGGLTTAEFRAQVSKLEREAGKIEAQNEAILADHQARQERFDKALSRWQDECTAFFEKHPQYRDDPLAGRDLNDVVRALQTKTKGSIYDPAIIERAHAILEQRAGRSVAEAPAPKPKTAQRRNPPSLGGLPVAEQGDVGQGEFAHLDRLLEAGKSAEYEAALAAMSDAQRARWEQAG